MSSTNQQRPRYRGRFAPSPSGALHFGSLVAALASFLDAKHHQGLWLVRIEDIDPPRAQAGADLDILNTLEQFGLHWDEPVLYQSQQTDYYQSYLQQLAHQGLSYFCQCSRADIKAIGGIYQGHCRTLRLGASNHAIRLCNRSKLSSFNDLLLGHYQGDKTLASEDFILKRKDGLFAYQLAVVLDDMAQQINHVIRGADLLEPTLRQLSFFNILQQQAPAYGHVPLVINGQGYKLSKQNRAPALNKARPQPELIAALTLLGQQPPAQLHYASVAEIIHWASINWSRTNVPKRSSLVLA
jgi:glutamyl-Q tRNA(Asp) synthetase